MKSLAIVFSLTFIYSASLAQGTSNRQQTPTTRLSDQTVVKKEQRFQLGDLKGARAKNHPTHAYKSSKAVVAAPAEVSEKRRGPAAKNYKPWRDDTETQHLTVTKKKRKNLKGPRAKNRKPWDNR